MLIKAIGKIGMNQKLKTEQAEDVKEMTNHN